MFGAEGSEALRLAPGHGQKWMPRFLPMPRPASTVQGHNVGTVSALIRWHNSQSACIKLSGGRDPHDFSPDLAASVILGSRMTDEDKAQVRDWIVPGPTNSKIYEARRDETAFRLDFADPD
jgi:hypothetical protein